MSNQLTFIEEPSQPCQKPLRQGEPNLKTAVRNQIEFNIGSLDDLIDQDHIVRLVWDYVQKLDMDSILSSIQSIKGSVGRPATDPKILLALWLFATLDGIVSARMITDYCKEHVAYRWLCGGVNINHHTLSDFAVKYADAFEDFLTQSIAILMKQGWVDIQEVAQDGFRVRAHAGSGSFKTGKKLKALQKEAKKYLAAIRKEDSNTARTKKAAAAHRAKEEREKKLQEAIQELKKVQENRKKIKRKAQPTPQELDEMRASKTDPEARKMKMADGGFRPAYNIQFVSAQKGQAIIEVVATNKGSDKTMIVDMIRKVTEKYKKTPSRWLVDAGYMDISEITKAAEEWEDCAIYMPGIHSKNRKDPYKPMKKDSPEVLKWRERMKSEEGKTIYKRRGCTAEFSNAQVSNYGMRQFLVRGLSNVRAIAYRFALVHNMQRFFTLSRS